MSDHQPVPVTRIGVVNWDCCLPSSTFFGGYATRSLGETQFRERIPYFAIDKGNGNLDFTDRSVTEYEDEMKQAIAAGIDYFAYCWYDRIPHQDHLITSAASTVDDRVYELASARLKHLQSPLRERLNLCAILITCHPYSDDSLKDLVEVMKQPYYEKIDGRPLVYLFATPWEETLARLRAFCAATGTPDPYAVLMTGSQPNNMGNQIQALCEYARPYKTDTYEALIDNLLAQNSTRAASGLPVIPHFTMGWNPQPRVNHPVPWTEYPSGPYHPTATREQLLAGARRLKQWMSEHASSCTTGHVFAFAWNEFEEGGWICPTWGDNGQPDVRRRDAFADIATLWKQC